MANKRHTVFYWLYGTKNWLSIKIWVGDNMSMSILKTKLLLRVPIVGNHQDYRAKEYIQRKLIY